jgi:hypothetical protein
MKIPRDMYKELQRLEKAVNDDSKHLVQCPKCGDWLDLRELGNFKRDSNSWRMYVALGLFGGMVTMIWLVVD